MAMFTNKCFAIISAPIYLDLPHIYIHVVMCDMKYFILPIMTKSVHHKSFAVFSFLHVREMALFK